MFNVLRGVCGVWAAVSVLRILNISPESRPLPLIVVRSDGIAPQHCRPRQVRQRLNMPWTPSHIQIVRSSDGLRKRLLGCRSLPSADQIHTDRKESKNRTKALICWAERGTEHRRLQGQRRQSGKFELPGEAANNHGMLDRECSGVFGINIWNRVVLHYFLTLIFY